MKIISTNGITHELYIRFIENNNNLFWIDEAYPDSPVVEEYKLLKSYYKLNNDFLFSLLYHNNKLKIFYENISDSLLIILDDISNELNANLYIKDTQIYPPKKISAARARFAKKSTTLKNKYQSESFGVNNMWLAFKSDLNTVQSNFKLKGKETTWEEALNEMEQCNGMFLFEQNGWTFLAGQLVDSMFKCNGENEKEIEAEHVAKLLEWGKSFSDVQLFMQYDRSTYFDAFYRVLNGKMIYGTYYTESYQTEYGAMPIDIKLLPESNAISASGVWSINPDSLRYEKSTLEGAWVVSSLP